MRSRCSHLPTEPDLDSIQGLNTVYVNTHTHIYTVCVRLELAYLYLPHGQVQEGVLIAHADQTLRAFTAHAGSQTSVQLHHGQFVQTRSYTLR